MFFPHDEKMATFGGNIESSSDIVKFIKAYRNPAVSIFDGENAADIFADGRPIFFLFRDKDDKGLALEQELRDIAPSLNRQLIVSVAGSSEPMDQRLMDYVGVEPEDLPTARIVMNPMSGMV